jgi:TP901 family phage tail tape measure protein
MAIIVPIVSAWNPAGLNKAIADIKRAKTGMDKFAAGAQGIGTQMTQIGTNLSTKVSLPLALIGASAVRVAADFEVAMAQVGVATNTPVEGLKNLSDLAKQLGADTIFSANEAADAMLELSKAGLTPAQIEAGALSNTLNLAAASGMALAESAIVMSAGMNTFNLGASDSVSIVDALAGAANASAADVADIAMALQQTGQQAVASGLTIQETTAALAAFADAGVRGSDAGTSFKTFLQRLNPVSKEARERMLDLGLEFFDSAGNMKDLTEIAGELQKGFTGLTQEQRLAAMQTIFGSDSLRAANILFDEGATGIQKYIDASTKSGAAQDMATARMSGTAGALEAMRGSIETASLALGDALAPVVKSVAKFIQDLANKFTNLDPKVQTAIASVGIFLTALGPLLMISGSLITAIGKLVAVFSTLSGAVGGAAGAMAIATGPVGIFVAALAGAILIVVALWRESDKFRTAVTNAFNAVKTAVVNAVNSIKTKLDENKSSLDNLKSAFKALGDFIGTFIIPIFSFFATGAIRVVTNYIGFLIDAVGFVIRAFNTWLGYVQTAITFIGNLVTRFNDAAKAGEGFGGRVARAISILLGPIVTLFNWIGNVRKALGGTADQAVKFIDASAIAATRADDKLMNVDKTTLKLGTDSIKTSTDINALGISLGTLAGSAGKSAKATGKFKDEINASNKVLDKLNNTLQNQRDKLQSLRDAKKAYAQEVSNSVAANFSFANSLTASTDSQKLAAETAKKLKDAQVAYKSALASKDVQKIADAFKDMQSAQTDAANALKNKQSFMQVLRDQASQVTGFTKRVKKLLAMGLSEAGIQQVLAAGSEAGTKIADEIIAGGAGAIKEVNALTKTVESVADSLGASASAKFFNAGITQGKALIDGIKQAIKDSGFVISGGKVLLPKALQKGLDSGKLSGKQIKQLNAILKSGGEIPALAKGGIVTGPTLALIGEAGPEAVIPLTGNNSGMGNVYNINVNAGIGTNGAQVGRDIVDAIKKYERASGPVFASA